LDGWNKNKTDETQPSGEITLGPSSQPAAQATPEAEATPISHAGRPVSGLPFRKMQVAVSQPILSSSAAGQKTTSISFPGVHPDDIASWEILIKTSAGSIARKIDGTGKPFSAIEWDGSDDFGKTLPAGIYQVNLRTFNSANDLLSDDSAPVQIVPALTHFGMSVNTPYLSLARGKVNPAFIFTPDPGGSFEAASWELEVENSKTNEVVYDHKGRLKIPKTIRWNGRTSKAVPAPDGVYECVLTALDKLGNSLKTDPVEVIIRSAPPALSLKGDDHWADFSKAEKMKFQINAEDTTGVQSWSLKLLDDDDDVLKTFLGQDSLPPEVVWDGKMDSSEMVPDGSFVRARLQVRDKAGNSAQSDDFPVQVEVAAPSVQSLSLNLTTVNFADGSEALSADAKKEIQSAALSIKPYLTKSIFVIKGYAASAETGDLVTLSYDRADNVREYMMKAFAVPADKIFALGYATRETLTDASGDEPADKQRRATIVIYTQP
jgi:outer membrane protein OmpA-like peptidoglycan-associated protein